MKGRAGDIRVATVFLLPAAFGFAVFYVWPALRTVYLSIRGILLLPYLIANVVVALVWFTMLDAQLGVVNQMDIKPFTVQIDDRTTHLYPITNHATDIQAIMEPAMDAVLSFKADPSSLTKVNDQINELFK